MSEKDKNKSQFNVYGDSNASKKKGFLWRILGKKEPGLIKQAHSGLKKKREMEKKALGY